MKIALQKIKLGLKSSDWQRLKEAECLAVWHKHDCGYAFKGKLYCGLMLSIIEKLHCDGISSVAISKPYSDLNPDNGHGDPLSFNRDFMLSDIIDRLKYWLLGVPKNRRIRLWEKVLDVVNPKYIIAIMPDVFLCRAARNRGIRIYDLQHGVISAAHAWYGKTAKGLNPSDLPTDYLCWDSNSAGSLELWTEKKGIAVHVIGNPWFERFRNPCLDDELVRELIGQVPKVINKKPRILVTMQWGLEHYYEQESDHNGYLPSSLIKAIASPLKKYHWLIRLHPVQYWGRERLNCLRFLEEAFGSMDNVEWKQATELPLPLILSRVDLHITDMSSVVIEASWFGVPSALLSVHIVPGGRLEGFFDEQRRTGYAAVVNQDIASIETWIQTELSSKKRSGNDESVEDVLLILKCNANSS